MSKERSVREKTIIRTSVIGIAANVVLVVFKALVGIAANSIAVILDAVNNLSDALSSIVTIIGAEIGAKAPDKKHPFGHGRAEYMSQVVVAAIILYAGITSIVESGKKIIEPQAADYSVVSLVIISVAVVVKLVLGMYVRKKGRQVNSGSLEASGTDALFDAVISVSVLASAVIYLLFGISLEAYVGVIIALLIIKSGIEMVRDAVDEMLGIREEKGLSAEIKATVMEEDGVRGVYDLILHNYGPDHYLASAHIEVDDTLTAAKLDAMMRSIQARVYEKHSVIMTAIGIYSVNTADDEAAEIRSAIRKTVMSYDSVLQFHGFYIDPKSKSITFDIIIDFDADRQKIYAEILKEIRSAYPDYNVRITLDNDMSD